MDALRSSRRTTSGSPHQKGLRHPGHHRQPALLGRADQPERRQPEPEVSRPWTRSIAAHLRRHAPRPRNKNSLYDSYIRAIRWASDRIEPSSRAGSSCYVSNGGYIDSNTADGLRKSLADEFHAIYCFNLRGNREPLVNYRARKGQGLRLGQPQHRRRPAAGEEARPIQPAPRSSTGTSGITSPESRSWRSSPRATSTPSSGRKSPPTPPPTGSTSATSDSRASPHRIEGWRNPAQNLPHIFQRPEDQS